MFSPANFSPAALPLPFHAYERFLAESGRGLVGLITDKMVRRDTF